MHHPFAPDVQLMGVTADEMVEFLQWFTQKFLGRGCNPVMNRKNRQKMTGKDIPFSNRQFSIGISNQLRKLNPAYLI
jgi:hypothetical protein